VTLVLLSAPIWLPLVARRGAGHAGRSQPVLLAGTPGPERSRLPHLEAALDGAGRRRVSGSYLAETPEARAEWDATQKLKQDPRITVVGRMLRKTSLDELPQLFNVLTGDMSLVGPRPIMVNQKALYPGQRYYDMRPGLTGLWQVSDRNECSFAGRVRFDDIYHRTMSFGTDLRILGQTVSVVLRGTGY
jgi:exopolysaccharide production protein ExoY